MNINFNLLVPAGALACLLLASPALAGDEIRLATPGPCAGEERELRVGPLEGRPLSDARTARGTARGRVLPTAVAAGPPGGLAPPSGGPGGPLGACDQPGSGCLGPLQPAPAVTRPAVSRRVVREQNPGSGCSFPGTTCDRGER